MDVYNLDTINLSKEVQITTIDNSQQCPSSLLFGFYTLVHIFLVLAFIPIGYDDYFEEKRKKVF